MNLNQFAYAAKVFTDGCNITSSKNDKLSKSMSKEFNKLVKECESKIEKSNLTEEDQQAVIEEFQKSISKIRDSFSAGKLREVCRECETVLKLLPGEKVSSHYLSTILLNAKQYKRVSTILEPAVKAHPKEIELRISLAEAYYHLENHMGAVKLLTEGEKYVTEEKDRERLTVRVAKNLLKINQKDTATQLILVCIFFLLSIFRILFFFFFRLLYKPNDFFYHFSCFRNRNIDFF